jgi:hypothetical protein
MSFTLLRAAHTQHDQKLEQRIKNRETETPLLTEASQYEYYDEEEVEPEPDLTPEDIEKIEHDLMCNTDLIDAQLSAFGQIQCEDIRPQLNKLEIGTVYMSPLRSAIETAFEAFKEHPNFQAIRFVILPMLRERITKAADVPFSW